MDTLHVVLQFERETKRTVLYKTSLTQPVSNIYVNKDALGVVYPNEIKVTIEEAPK